MRWPWQSAPVEHRSSLTDQVITAILAAATGGGARPALATAALESCATLYASALSACTVSGPSSVTRALTADWRASVASSLIRSGQALYIIGADPVSGLSLAPVSHWDVHGGPRPSSWSYRVELAGPSGTAWESHRAAEVLQLRWVVDPARPWAGVSPLQHAADTGSLSGWLDKRLSEEASGPVGSFLPVAKYDADPDADLGAADINAADPLAALRRDIGAAKGGGVGASSTRGSTRTKRSPRTSTPARCGTRTGNDPATKRQRRPIVAIASRPDRHAAIREQRQRLREQLVETRILQRHQVGTLQLRLPAQIFHFRHHVFPGGLDRDGLDLPHRPVDADALLVCVRLRPLIAGG